MSLLAVGFAFFLVRSAFADTGEVYIFGNKEKVSVNDWSAMLQKHHNIIAAPTSGPRRAMFTDAENKHWDLMLIDGHIVVKLPIATSDQLKSGMHFILLLANELGANVWELDGQKWIRIRAG